MRIQKFLESKTIHSENSSSESTETLKHCELCDFMAKSERGLEIHMGKNHKSLDQLDGNISFNSTFESKEYLLTLKSQH